mmetsp:Transcript_88141/g.128847  ORF Transcript_88141/g.128847 Transcript_88141/m.128847 type:complete len:259 (-) Transcript_88141:2988-3764(-)
MRRRSRTHPFCAALGGNGLENVDKIVKVIHEAKGLTPLVAQLIQRRQNKSTFDCKKTRHWVFGVLVVTRKLGLFAETFGSLVALRIRHGLEQNMRLTEDTLGNNCDVCRGTMRPVPCAPVSTLAIFVAIADVLALATHMQPLGKLATKVAARHVRCRHAPTRVQTPTFRGLSLDTRTGVGIFDSVANRSKHANWELPHSCFNFSLFLSNFKPFRREQGSLTRRSTDAGVYTWCVLRADYDGACHARARSASVRSHLVD